MKSGLRRCPQAAAASTNASATDYTLTIMTVVALVFTPLVLAYEAWSYWVFRRRISVRNIPGGAAVTGRDEAPATSGRPGETP